MRMRTKTRTAGRSFLVSLAVAALASAPLAAQEPDPQEAEPGDLDLPRHVADEVVAFFNDPATIRFNGRSSVPGGREIAGDVGVLGGPLVVAGRVVGDVVVLNGDLRMEEGGRIAGDVMVIGGTLVDRQLGGIEGDVVVYEEPLRYRESRGRISVREDEEDLRGLRWGHARLIVRSAGSYNRIEGLPVLFGPTFRTAEPNPILFEALGIWRTESGLSLDDDELGYMIRAEQRIGRRPRLAFGAGAHSRISAVADWGLTSVESSLSTFFLHHDFRDYYEREGWSTWGRIDDPGTRLSLRLEYRDEEHGYVPVSSPWTLRNNEKPWRPQPLVAEGDLRTVVGELTYDGRNDAEDPTDGWYGTLRVVRGVDGDLRTPGTFLEDPPRTFDPASVPHDFTTGLLDLRRYTRVTPTSDLSFRLLYAGAVDDDPVPTQFQQALGGEGSLPGYPLFSGDCGARSETRLIDRGSFDDDEDPRQPVFPRYGCDRVVLFQLAYRSSFDVSLDLGPDDEDDWDEEWDWYPVVDLTPAWAFFLDAGRGWGGAEETPDPDTMADVGLGLFFGDIGLYWAYPLTGDDRGVNFFVRLERRF